MDYPERMTVNWIDSQISAMKLLCDEEKVDNGKIHNLEQKLHFMVLNYISNNLCDDPPSCAKAALKTHLLEFLRYV